MSYRPLSPGKTERTGSSRDRLYWLSSDIYLDSPFVPEAFPCYTPTVCVDPILDATSPDPDSLVDDFGNDLVDNFGNPIVTDP